MASPVAYTQAEAARLEAERAADRERAEREAADQEATRADKEAADEAAAREAADAADQEAAARDAADRERADEEAADEEATDQEVADTEAADREATDQEATDHAADQEATDRKPAAEAAEPAAQDEPAAAARRAARRRWRAALHYVKTEAKIRCTLRRLRPAKAAPCVMDRLRDASAVARRLAELEGELADDARASAAILQRGVGELGGSSADLEDDVFAARRSAQEALVQTLVARAPPVTPVISGPPVAISDGGEWRDALENFEDDVDKRFAEYAVRQQKLLDDFHVEVEVFTATQVKTKGQVERVQTDLDRVASVNEARWSALDTTNASRDGKVELLSGAWAAASARRAAEGVARLAAAPPARGEAPLYAEAPAAAPGDLDDVWDRLHTKADGTAVLKLRDELREIAASLAGDTVLTRRRKAICSGALGVRARSGYVLKDGIEVCISCQHPGSPAKRETVSFEGDKLRLARTQRTPTRAKPSVGRVRPASAGALRNAVRSGFVGRMTGRPSSATVRVLADKFGDTTGGVIDLRYPVRRRDERSEQDRKLAGYPSY